MSYVPKRHFHTLNYNHDIGLLSIAAARCSPESWLPALRIDFQWCRAGIEKIVCLGDLVAWKCHLAGTRGHSHKTSTYFPNTAVSSFLLNRSVCVPNALAIVFLLLNHFVRIGAALLCWTTFCGIDIEYIYATVIFVLPVASYLLRNWRYSRLSYSFIQKLYHYVQRRGYGFIYTAVW